MVEERSQDNAQQFSATDSLKKLVIDKLGKTIDMACRKEEAIANYTTETGFVRSVKLMKSLLLRHTPDEIRVVISELYKKLDTELEKIEKSTWSESTKAINKMKVSDEVSMQVLELLTVVIQYSSMSTEYKDMEVFGDFKELIKAIRSPEPVKMFSTEIESEV
jgi:hypothetical protein